MTDLADEARKLVEQWRKAAPQIEKAAVGDAGYPSGFRLEGAASQMLADADELAALLDAADPAGARLFEEHRTAARQAALAHGFDPASRGGEGFIAGYEAGASSRRPTPSREQLCVLQQVFIDEIECGNLSQRWVDDFLALFAPEAAPVGNQAVGQQAAARHVIAPEHRSTALGAQAVREPQGVENHGTPHWSSGAPTCEHGYTSAHGNPAVPFFCPGPSTPQETE